LVDIFYSEDYIKRILVSLLAFSATNLVAVERIVELTHSECDILRVKKFQVMTPQERSDYNLRTANQMINQLRMFFPEERFDHPVKFFYAMPSLSIVCKMRDAKKNLVDVEVSQGPAGSLFSYKGIISLGKKVVRFNLPE